MPCQAGIGSEFQDDLLNGTSKATIAVIFAGYTVLADRTFVCDYIAAHSGGRDFGNARGMRNLCDDILCSMKARLIQADDLSRLTNFQLTEDFQQKKGKDRQRLCDHITENAGGLFDIWFLFFKYAIGLFPLLHIL